jgi:hypothetical protein
LDNIVSVNIPDSPLAAMSAGFFVFWSEASKHSTTLSKYVAFLLIFKRRRAISLLFKTSLSI